MIRKYSEEQYKELSNRFNSQSLLGKLIIIRNNSELFSLEMDDINIRLRLSDDTAMYSNIDDWFDFPKFISFTLLKDIFSLSDINIKELK